MRSADELTTKHENEENRCSNHTKQIANEIHQARDNVYIINKTHVKKCTSQEKCNRNERDVRRID